MSRIGQTKGTMAWILLLLAFLCVLDENKGAKVDLSFEPDFNPMFVKEGSKFTIECKARNVPKNKDVNLEHDDYGDLELLNFDVRKKVTMDNKKAGISVFATKDAVEDGDRGVYTCTVSNITAKMFTLVVTTVLTQSANVTVGDDVTIRCDPDTTFDQLDLTWTKDGKPLETIPDVKNRIKYGKKNRTLTLQKAVQEDAGEYECTMTFFRGNYGEQSFKDMAKMYGKPYFPSGAGDKTLSLSGNESIDLSCDAFGYPKPDVTWLKDDEVVQSDKRVTIKDTDSGSRLLIEKIMLRDSGTYVCNVENMLGRKQRSFKVSIEGVISSASFLRYGLSQVLFLASVLFLTL